MPRDLATPGKNKKVAVCGAYRWPDGPFVYGHGEGHPNTTRFVEMITQIAHRARRTGRRIVLVLDNGSYHNSRRSRQVLDQFHVLIRVVWLPTYSSEELNDIEGVWKHLKEDYFSRMLVQDREQFEGAVVALLDELRPPGGLRRVLRPRTRKTLRRKIVRVA